MVFIPEKFDAYDNRAAMLGDLADLVQAKDTFEELLHKAERNTRRYVNGPVQAPVPGAADSIQKLQSRRKEYEDEENMASVNASVRVLQIISKHTVLLATLKENLAAHTAQRKKLSEEVDVHLSINVVVHKDLTKSFTVAADKATASGSWESKAQRARANADVKTISDQFAKLQKEGSLEPSASEALASFDERKIIAMMGNCVLNYADTALTLATVHAAMLSARIEDHQDMINLRLNPQIIDQNFKTLFDFAMTRIDNLAHAIVNAREAVTNGFAMRDNGQFRVQGLRPIL